MKNDDALQSTCTDIADSMDETARTPNHWCPRSISTGVAANDPMLAPGFSYIHLGEVYGRVQRGDQPPERAPIGDNRRSEILRHLKRLSSWMDRPLQEIPAQRGSVARWLHEQSPSTLNTTPRELTKIASSINVALEIARAATPLRNVRPLQSSEWLDLTTRARDYDSARGVRILGDPALITSFAHYCEALSVYPASVTLETLANFSALRSRSRLAKKRDPNQECRKLHHLWNRYSTAVIGWPPAIPFAKKREQVAFKLAAFPLSFQNDIAEYKRTKGVRDYDRLYSPDSNYLDRAIAGVEYPTESTATPLRGATIDSHILELRLLASAVVRRKVMALEEITSIESVLSHRCLFAALAEFDKRNGRNSQSTARQSTITKCYSVMRRWAPHMVAKESEHYKRVLKHLEEERYEMSASDRTIVNTFILDPDTLAELLCLPPRIIVDAEVERKRTGHISSPLAARVEAAVHLMILCALPIRRSTVAQTRLDRIERHPSGAYAHLVWGPDITKHKKPLRASINGWRLQLLDLFIAHYRPVLAAGESHFLFPHRRSHSAVRHRQPNSLAKELRRVINQEMGISVRHHLWRKIIGGFLFDATGDPKVLRYALGHSENSRSTGLYVDELKSLWASRKLDQVVSDRMGGQPSTVKLGTTK